MNKNSKRYLILDTNILQLIGSKPLNRSSQVSDYIIEIMNQGYEKAISEITAYEAIQRCSETKEKQVLEKLQLFTNLEISRAVLMTAAWLSDIYRMEDLPDSQISDCDKIIAATAILTNSYLLTANGNDFPRPFFNEIGKKLIQFNDKNRDLLNVIYLLNPDINVFNHRLSKRPKN